jgi:hypothetical protein
MPKSSKVLKLSLELLVIVVSLRAKMFHSYLFAIFHPLIKIYNEHLSLFDLLH